MRFILLIVLLSGCAAQPRLTPAEEATEICLKAHPDDPYVRQECIVQITQFIAEHRASEEAMRKVYRQERMRDQILQHGKGGCTPDFSTGGCL